MAIIVIEPGMGYLIKELRARRPGSKIIAINTNAQLAKLCAWKGDVTWHPSSGGGTLRQFLVQQLWQLPFPNITVVVLPIINQLSPHFLTECRSIIESELAVINAHLTTIRHFSRRWIRNSIKNYSTITRVVDQLPNCTLPICLATGGPSLNQYLPLLRSARQSIQLWAVSSATTALHAAGLTPDLVVATDGSNWATHHLRLWNTRAGSGRADGGGISPTAPAPPLLAMPLTAATSAEIGKYVLFLFRQGFPIEEELAEFLKTDSATLQPHGSVATTAIELTKHSQAPALFLFGLDLSYHNGMLHCRPHAFDPLFTTTQRRLSPYETWIYSRWHEGTRHGEESRITTQHAIYRKEVATIIAEIKQHKHVYQLSPLSPLDGVRSIDQKEFTALCRKHRGTEDTADFADYIAARNHPLPSIESRKTHIHQITERFIDTLQGYGSKEALPPHIRELAFALSTRKHYQELWASDAPAQQYSVVLNETIREIRKLRDSSISSSAAG